MKGMFCLTDGQKYSFISFHAMNFFIGSCEETQCHVARKLMYVILIGSNRIYFVWFHNKTSTLENTFFSYVTLVLYAFSVTNLQYKQFTLDTHRAFVHEVCTCTPWIIFLYTVIKETKREAKKNANCHALLKTVKELLVTVRIVWMFERVR